MNLDFSRINSLRTLHVPMVAGRNGLSGFGLGQSMNLSAGKSARQSSTLTDTATAIVGSANKAVDGNRSGDFFANQSVTHTNIEKDPWWEIDLGQIYNISKVDIYNRSDSKPERLANFYVFISDNAFTSNDISTLKSQSTVSNFFFSGTVGAMATIPINKNGRFVRIQLQNDAEALTLAEVEVYGGPFQPGQSTGMTTQPPQVIVAQPVSTPRPWPTAPAPVSTTPPAPTSFLTQTFSLFGLNIPYYVPIAAGGIYFFFLRKGKGRRRR